MAPLYTCISGRRAAIQATFVRNVTHWSYDAINNTPCSTEGLLSVIALIFRLEEQNLARLKLKQVTQHGRKNDNIDKPAKAFQFN
jgi:hypothetical protein